MTMTLFQLTYGQDVVLPQDINVKSLRVTKQHILSTDDYQRLLVLKLESVGEGHLIAYENIK